MCYFEHRDNVVQARINRVMAELPGFCQRFTLYCNRRLTKLTECSYLYVIRQFFVFYGSQVGMVQTEFTVDDLGNITTADVEAFLGTFTHIGSNTVCYKWSVIKTFLGFYYVRRDIDKNVAEPILMPKLKEKPIVRLTQNEVVRLLNAVDSFEQDCPQYKHLYETRHKIRDKTILLFFLSTGVRVSELVGLDIKHIDFDNASFTVTRKGGKIETLYMTDDLWIQLALYMDSIDTSDENAPLFSSRDNPRISDNAIRLLVEKYCKLAGIKKYSPHKLRATFGTFLYRQTRDIFAVSQVLGHASVNTTRKYYAALDEDIKRGAMTGFALI